MNDSLYISPDNQQVYVNRILAGDEHALNHLCSDAITYATSYGTSKHHPDVDDFAQRCAIKIHKRFTTNAHKHNPEGSLIGFMFRTIHNLFIDDVRKCKRKKHLHTESFSLISEKDIRHIDDLAADYDHYTMDEKRDFIYNAVLAVLPKKQRAILELYYFDDLKFEDIATTLDISVNTALGRKRYACTNARNALGDDFVRMIELFLNNPDFDFSSLAPARIRNQK